MDMTLVKKNLKNTLRMEKDVNMSNIVIGIVSKHKKSNDSRTDSLIRDEVKQAIFDNGALAIGILSPDDEIMFSSDDFMEYDEKINKSVIIEQIKLCDGIIIQGGSDIYPYHFQIVDYCFHHNIPILGICMGHQILGLYSNNSNSEDDLIKINNHYNKDKKHIINIKEDTIMYKLFGPTLEVNTRHLYAINKVKKPFIVSAVSQDNIIESIEYIDESHFLLGIQFHPEDLDNTEALYNYFLKEVYKRKH